MSNLALVTGASSGIGLELARCHAARGGDLVLCARRQDALEAVKAELEAAHGIAAHVFAADLAAPGAAEALHRAVLDAGLEVGILINCAGFGGYGLHVERDLADEQAMIDLNIKALVTLTHEFGRDMAGRGSGRVLNVGSTAGFLPGPNQAVYFATKAFVASFSQAVDHELRPKGVTVTVLAPSYVETGFAKAADLEGTQMVKAGGADAADVAKCGYEAMLAGRLVVVNKPLMGFVLARIAPLLPRRMVLKMAARSQSK
jgi:hypothetical protein